MLEENRNLKDSKLNQPISLRDGRFFISYTKTNKLITALYMVTDVLNENEPIRHKLRTLGIDIVSDTNLAEANKDILKDTAFFSAQLNKKILEILSLLEIAFSLEMISGMNFNILKKEFIDLKNSIQKAKNDPFILDLLKEEPILNNSFEKQSYSKGQSIGQEKTRIGVQKGSTLLKVLSDKMGQSPFGLNNNINRYNNFNVLKNKRREKIISIIKDKKSGDLNFDGLSIKDIIISFKNLGEDLGEKTLQRELNSMMADGIIAKAGSKRWSRYFLK